MSNWLKSLVGYMLIVSVTTQLLPHKKYEYYVKVFTGFLLILLVLQPILRIGSASAFLETKIFAFIEEQEKMEEKIGKEAKRFQEQSGNMGGEIFESIEVLPVERVEVLIND